MNSYGFSLRNIRSTGQVTCRTLRKHELPTRDIGRSAESVLREVRALRRMGDYRGVISDVGGPTANMYRIGCKSPAVEAACRKPSCVYPGICPNLNTDHTPLIQLYRKARALPGGTVTACTPDNPTPART